MRSQFLLYSLLFSTTAFATGDAPLPEFLHEFDEATRHVVTLDYAGLRALHTDDIKIDTALNLGLIHTGTPYLWGGDSWEDGVDCSHFTRKIFSTAATGYSTYMQTRQLRDLEADNGLVRVDPGDMQPGDLLVYGYYDDDDNWQGHVVVLIDADYEAGGYRGLVLGSHGDVGVQFLTVAGFPDYFRKSHITLRNVLRLEAN